MKIRGTAHHVGEKYLQLARDAHSSGDPVRAESYLQHAEHYFRVIAAAQQAQQAQHGYGRQPGEALDYDDDDDGDDGSMPDRFASPSERQVQPAFADRQPFQQGQGHNQGHGQAHNQGHGQAHGERSQPYAQGDRGQGDRAHGDRGQGERGQAERGYDNRNGRNYDNRAFQDRTQQDRSHQGHGHGAHGAQSSAAQNGAGQGSQQSGFNQGGSGHSGGSPNGFERNAPARSDGERGGSFQQDRQGSQDRPLDRSMRDQPREHGRDYDNRPRGPRPPRPAQEVRQPVVDEPGNGLPAFITAPTRPSAEHALPQPSPQPHSPQPHEGTDQPAAQGEIGEETLGTRPRRRRRSKADFADKAAFAGDGSREGAPMEPREAEAPEPIGD